MKWQLVILCTFMVCGTVFGIEVNTCSDDFPGIPGAVDFASEGCDEFPCPLVRGTTSNSNITFRIPADTATSKIKIEAKVGIWVPFPQPDDNACHNLLNSFCPLEENEIVTYHLAIPIAKIYPGVFCSLLTIGNSRTKLSMDLRIQFLDEKGNSMMCMKVPCAVVDPPSL